MSSVYERILAFNKGRLPDIVKLKYSGMAENVCRLYRGICHLFYEDFCKAERIPESPLSWICGDLHMENYGSYKGDNRLAYFELIKNKYDDIRLMIEDMAFFTASVQLRSSGRQGSAITGELIEFGHDTNWHEGVLKYAKNMQGR